MERPNFVDKYSHKAGYTTPKGESMTDQQYKDETDIVNVLSKYNMTGALPPDVRGEGSYADVSEFGDFTEQLNRVVEAREKFDALPSSVRDRFGNSPQAFYEFVSDPSNAAECVKLGLAVERKEEVPIPVKVEVVNSNSSVNSEVK